MNVASDTPLSAPASADFRALSPVAFPENVEEHERRIPNAGSAAILRGHPVTTHAVARRHREVYTGDFLPYGHGEEGGWYGKAGTADCGHCYLNVDPVTGKVAISTGYATEHVPGVGERTLCYACADSAEAARMDAMDSTRARFHAYVHEENGIFHLATWTGGKLAWCLRHDSFWGTFSRMHTWTFARGADTFYGRNSGPGCYITVRKHAKSRLVSAIGGENAGMPRQGDIPKLVRPGDSRPIRETIPKGTN